MRLKEISLVGFKSFAKKAELSFASPVTAVVGPNGSGKSNVVEAFRFVLGEQSMKSMRGKSGADLIFRGSSGAAKLSRAAVSISFDNTDKVFGFQTERGKSPLLFETITFTREIFADGTSRYLMNDTEIRLKQMVELLASVNIGTSSHHIISQGEADSILRANARDRREMLEDALGLKIYHYRIKESESKLAKTMDTLKDVQSLRRELAPHLKFLQKQVEKVEKGKAIRSELEDTLLRFMATEREQLRAEDQHLSDATAIITQKKKELEARLPAFPQAASVERGSAAEIARLRASAKEFQEQRRSIEQKMGRMQGIIEAHRAFAAQQSSVQTDESAVSFSPREYQQLLADIEHFIAEIQAASSIEEVRRATQSLGRLIETLRSRQQSAGTSRTSVSASSRDLSDAAHELEALERELAGVLAREESAAAELTARERESDMRLQESTRATHERYEVLGAIKDCDAELQILAVTVQRVRERKEQFDSELREAGFLFGPSFLSQLREAPAYPELDLHDLRRSIDRLKIRYEEHSGIGTEVLSEYESTKERDEFLSREVADIEASISNLTSLIVDLKKVLDEKFTEGVKVVNDRFGEFFKTMFGGGNAFLSITMEKRRKARVSEEDELLDGEAGAEVEAFDRGIEVHVSLPEKKVKDLQMLSGGERSLVSIALLFAISQVNPPPFLVLDETDAALDEANSRRYGDMIERLSAYSQLIVVTHNRETMSRASVLYGVTLGADGSSKLLSIKFDEAVKVAK